MNLAGKKLAILGGTRITCEIVRAARALGVHTTVIDYNLPEDSPAKQIADEHALVSVADTKTVAAYLREHGIDGVTMGYTDSILGMYADICKEVGLPCYATRDQFRTFTDKRIWKRLCVEYGVPTAREYHIDEALCGEEVEFPLFVKPSDGSGARGTSIVSDADELRIACDYARGFAKNGEVLVEKYLNGPEVTVFWLFIDGRYEVFLLGNRLVKNNQPGVIPLPCGYTFPSSVLPRYLKEIAPKVRKMLSSQGVRNGMMFMQCIVQDGLPYVYDIGYRLTGSLEQHITAHIAGYSAMDMLIHHALTGRMTDDAQIWEKVDKGLRLPCYNVSFLMRPGTLERFDGLQRLDEDSSVIEYVKAHVEGETLPLEAKGELRQIALRVLGSVETAAELEDALMRVQSAVRLLDPAGNELNLPGLDHSDFVGNVPGLNED